MKKKITLKFLVLIAFGFIALQSASAFTAEIGQGTANLWPAVNTASPTFTLGSGVTESLTSGVGNKVNTGTVLSVSNVLHYEINGTSVYVEGAVTANSATSNITEVTYGASTNSTTPGKTLGIIYSDQYPFNMNSVIGAESLTALPTDSVWKNFSGTIPTGTKSFRIYRRVYYNSTTKVASTGSATGFVQYGAGTTIRLAYLAYTVTPTGPQAPKVTSLSIDGAAGVFSGDTIRVNLLYSTYTAGVTPVATSLITATTDSTAVTTEIKSGGVDITSFIAGDIFNYSVTKSALTNTYIVITSASIPAPTASTPTNVSQAVKQGVAIAPIVFTLANTTAGVASGLPAGLAFDYATATISGTPTAAIGSYPYTVTFDGIMGSVPATVVKSGTITVKDPLAKTVAYLYTGTTATTPLYNLLNANYDVTVLTATNVAADTAALINTLKGFDLIVMSEVVNSANLTYSQLGKYIGVKPILNTKAHMYSKPNWPAGAGQNGATNDTTINVKSNCLSHPIFAGITYTNDSVITLAQSTGIIRYVTTAVFGSGVSAIASNKSSAGISIIEKNNETATDANKYMFVGLSAAAEAFTPNGLIVMKNVCDYLLGSTTFIPVPVPTSSTSAKAKTFKAYASNSSIIVEAELGAEVSVVDMTGNIIYSGAATTISNVQSGVYAVSVNGVAQKVLVK